MDLIKYGVGVWSFCFMNVVDVTQTRSSVIEETVKLGGGESLVGFSKSRRFLGLEYATIKREILILFPSLF